MHPLLESDVIECPHKGKVILQTNNHNAFKINNCNVIVESDLINAKILGCSYTTLGIPTPCTCISNIPKSCVSNLLKINDKGVILAENIGMILTDKGFPLILNNKPKSSDFLTLQS
ncbi:hypothetical protein DCO58_03405 [Helicobacter saguini]|uniref:Uncharacterized protein n=1 Tax=Helicobacter saguini TaxID=1548018 RepID=A0A347VSB1_9HELI|nr:hypothetical protein [Helicobacter saguini]MWV62581.1 hypothetical protein [Helicobacter saguini]MWV66745.1 hypothetical protein [Helicobacter saguini]MWV69096.1 hypothetical protein [Helicobacter saguini]MWV71350.1 hypothetical protein [Helicobacter saguini]TLD93986.1 hypothetical protein LS64_007445 [Helicobacter saguini]